MRVSQSRWPTWRVAGVTFLLFFLYGIFKATRHLDWNSGFEFQLSIISEGIGAGLAGGLVAALVCLGRNRTETKR
jgi:hypothetical protein